MNWEKFCLCAAVSVFSNCANAQEDVCVELAKQVGLNYTKYFDQDQERAIQKADLCSENYSSSSKDRKLQIQASYKVFSGSVTSSDSEVTEAQNKYCESKFGDCCRNKIHTAEARTVSGEGANIIGTCLGLTKSSLLPTLDIANNGTDVTMGIQYVPQTGGPITVKFFGPIDLKENTCVVTKPNSVVPVSRLSDLKFSSRLKVS
jgi:hypothetical protein